MIVAVKSLTIKKGVVTGKAHPVAESGEVEGITINFVLDSEVDDEVGEIVLDLMKLARIAAVKEYEASTERVDGQPDLFTEDDELEVDDEASGDASWA